MQYQSELHAFYTRKQPLNCLLCRQQYTGIENRHYREETIDREASVPSSQPLVAYQPSRTARRAAFVLRRTRLLLHSTDSREKERKRGEKNIVTRKVKIKRREAFSSEFLGNFLPISRPIRPLCQGFRIEYKKKKKKKRKKRKRVETKRWVHSRYKKYIYDYI